MKYVDKNENLKQLQQVELQVLKDFDKFCRENDIKYTLTYGTLIGAVRHKGFIPWDDDIDVFVSAEDYQKLEEIYNKKQTDGKYFFQTFKSDPYCWNLWGTIRLNNTSYIIDGYDYSRVNSGIYIDVFPLVDYPTEKVAHNKVIFEHRLCNVLANHNIVGKNYRFNDYGFMGKVLSILTGILPEKARLKLLNKVFYKLLNNKSDSGLCFSTVRTTAFYKKSYFENPIELEFEDGKFYCTKDYDEVLTYIYGDYMKLPPENERIGHGKVSVCFDTTEQ